MPVLYKNKFNETRHQKHENEFLFRLTRHHKNKKNSKPENLTREI